MSSLHGTAVLPVALAAKLTSQGLLWWPRAHRVWPLPCARRRRPLRHHLHHGGVTRPTLVQHGLCLSFHQDGTVRPTLQAGRPISGERIGQAPRRCSGRFPRLQWRCLRTVLRRQTRNFDRCCAFGQWGGPAGGAEGLTEVAAGLPVAAEAVARVPVPAQQRLTPWTQLEGGVNGLRECQHANPSRTNELTLARLCVCACACRAGPIPKSALAQQQAVQAVMIAVVCLVLVAAGADAGYIQGMVLGAGEWSGGMSLTDAGDTMDTLKANGVEWLRLIPTGFVASVASPEVYAINKTGSLFRSSTPAEVAQAIGVAHSKGFKVLLSPVVDPDWTVEPNLGNRCGCARGHVSRLEIGKNWTGEAGEAQWQTFFASYRQFLQGYLSASKVAGHEPDMLSVGAELLEASTTRAADWRSLIAWVRTQYSGSLTYAAIASGILQGTITWLDELDHIGIDAYVPLNSAPAIPLGQQHYWPQNGTVPSVAQFEEAWQPYLKAMANVSKTVGKPVVFAEVGYQSRWGSWRNPAGVLVLDPTDGSSWERSVSLQTQANMYEALLNALEPHSGDWWSGVFWWLARVDSTAGGSCDDSFVPLGKPAMDVLQSRWAAKQNAPQLAPPPLQRHWAASSNLDALPPAGKLGDRRSRDANASKICGAVFGAGQWSSPEYRLSSPGAMQSLQNLRATGATWVRLILTWFGDHQTSIAIYPANGTSPLSSATDDEIRAFVAEAKRLGMRVHMAPYIDPNWDLLSNCRGPSCGMIPGTTPKAARGEFGAGFTDAQWAEWFHAPGSYGAYIMHMAGLANETGCDMFSVASETATMFAKRSSDLEELVARVRAVFNGHVTAAVNSGQALANNYSWYQVLDSIGVEGELLLACSEIVAGKLWARNGRLP